nr:enolase C-terminal domain-like protein [Streptomyces coryli]
MAVSAYTVPTDAPEADGTFDWDSTTLVVVEALHDEATGIGWTYAPAAAADVIDSLLRPALPADRDPLDVPRAYELLSRAVRNAGRPGLIACAISAVDLALWDLKARLLGLPLCRLLGSVRDGVPVYGSGGFTTYHETHLAQQVRGWVHGQGIPRVKIKAGEAWGRAAGRDVDRVRKARAAMGPEGELYVDANGAYNRKQAVRVGRLLAAEGVSWFEEPVSSDDLEGLARVREQVTADVTAGEYGYALPYFAAMAPSVDCLQADVTRCGGLSVWLRVAALAEAHGLEVSAHGAPHLHAHAAACVPNLRHVEWFHDHVRIEAMLFDGCLDPAGGVIHPGANGAPGHGLSLRREEAKPYRVR